VVRCTTVCVRDSVHGRPAAGVPISTERLAAGGWVTVPAGETDDNGTLTLQADQRPAAGAHRLVVRSGDYYAKLGLQPRLSELTLVVPSPHDGSGRVEITITPCGCVVYAGA
jgi:5-hydroxyisourate hydrolase